MEGKTWMGYDCERASGADIEIFFYNPIPNIIGEILSHELL